MRTNLLLIVITAMLFTHPVYSQLDDVFGKVKKEIEKYIDTTSAPKKEKKTKKKADTTSVAVKKNFSTSVMKFTHEKEPDLTKGEPRYNESFNFKELITACVKLNELFGEYPVYEPNDKTTPVKQEYPTGDYYLKFFIDYTESPFVPTGVLMGNEISGKTSTLTLYCDECTGDAEAFEEQVKELGGGKHIIKVEMWKGAPGGLSGIEPVAEGEFTLFKPVLKKFSNVPAGMNNSSLEQGAVDAINRYAVQEGWKERYYKAIITSPDWYITRNEWTSIITGRSLEVTLLGKWPDGSCRFAEFSVWQSYDGSKYSGVMQYNGIGSMYDCICE
jgi:hypothetical protein